MCYGITYSLPLMILNALVLILTISGDIESKCLSVREYDRLFVCGDSNGLES